MDTWVKLGNHTCPMCRTLIDRVVPVEDQELQLWRSLNMTCWNKDLGCEEVLSVETFWHHRCTSQINSERMRRMFLLVPDTCRHPFIKVQALIQKMKYPQ
jgi:hypothetical protein